MISYEAYKLIHIFGVLFLIFSLGGLWLQATDDRVRVSDRVRKVLGMVHGAALLIILIAGFGLLARLGITQGFAWPWWVWGKIGIWILLGATAIVMRRTTALARSWWLVVPILGAAATYLAIYKPV
jgi:cytochrome bd-type quinol oxidase subunit 2